MSAPIRGSALGAGDSSPAPVSPPAISVPHQDLDLIAACAAFDMLEHAYRATDFTSSSGTPVGAAASTERERIVEQQAPFVELMVNTRAATPEGLAARARSLTLWNAELMDGGEGDVGERLTCAILRDLLKRSAHEPLPTCRVHVCEDVDFASGTDEARSAHGMRRNQIFSPWTLASLALASWETIYHRTVLMANGTCSPSEYQRMVTEKLEASCTSAMAMLTGKGKTAVMAPYLKAAEANAKRLRGK